MPLNILIELLRVKGLDKSIKQQLVDHVKKIRQQVEDITQGVITLQSDLRATQSLLNERFNTIDSYHSQIARYGANYPANPKVLQDLKLDIEMAYGSLKESKDY